MSIIIKSMKMPMRGERQRLTIQICSDGSVYVVKSCAIYAEEYLPKCPAKELPPHGRLIDADALDKEPCDVVEDRFSYSVFGYSLDQIRNAPTIIEAEEEKE